MIRCLCFLLCFTSLTAQGTVTDEQIQEIVNRLRILDVNKAADGDIQLQKQGYTTSRNNTDMAPLPLFASVNQKLFDSDLVQIYMKLMDDFKPDVNVVDIDTVDKTNAENLFLSYVFDGPIMTATYQFLQNTSAIDMDYPTFQNELRTLWFGQYARGSGAKGSCGFEHVFIGEWKKGEVDGLHNWRRYYQLEKAGQINYYGWEQDELDLQLTFKFYWETYEKPVGGFLFGTSPDFDMAVLSLCFLTKPGAMACKFSIDGQKVAVTSYPMVQGGKTFIGTAYPAIG